MNYDEIRSFRREGDGEDTKIARYDDLFVGLNEDETHPVDLDKSEVFDVYHNLVFNKTLQWAGTVHDSKNGLGFWTTNPNQIDNEYWKEFFAKMVPKKPASIDLAHHIARGTVDQYVLEQLVSNGEKHVEEQLADLFGPGSDRVMTPILTRDVLNTMDSSGHFKGSRAMSSPGSADVLIAKARESDEAMSKLYGLEPPVTDGEIRLVRELIKTRRAIQFAFDRVKGQICKCSWNPDGHDQDCPVEILQQAIGYDTIALKDDRYKDNDNG